MNNRKLARGLAQEILLNFKEELYAWLEILRTNWAFAVLILASLATALLVVNPLPPAQVFLGTGQKGSSYRQLGKQFSDYFAKYDIALHTIDSRGLSEDLSRVIAVESPVSAGFYVAGTADPDMMKELVSLGSIQFSPLWLFYRGKEMQGTEGLMRILRKQVAVGDRRGSTHVIVKKIVALHGLDVNSSARLLEMPHFEAAQKIRRGEIDAMFVLDSIDSPLIQPLLKDPDIHFFDFQQADAYTKKLPFLHKLIIPNGSLDLNRNIPPRDIHLLGSTITLLVENDTHPVIQWVFLKAARHISGVRQQFFSEPGFFPAYLDRDIPLSKVAKQYYQTGLPPLTSYVPLWLADFIDRIWFYLLAGITIFVPSIRLLYASRTYYSNQVIESAFIRLSEIDHQGRILATVADADHLLDKLDELEKDLDETWISSNNLKLYYSFKPRLKNVRDYLKDKRQQLEANSDVGVLSVAGK